MAATLGASDLSGKSLFGKTPVVETCQRINHRKVAEDKGMVLFFEELSTQTFYENFLVNRIDVENHDQRNQAKNGFGQLDLEERFRAAEERRERKGEYGKGQKKHDEDGVAAYPPVAFFQAAAFLRKFFGRSLRGRQTGKVSCIVHYSAGRKCPNSMYPT